MKLYLQSPRKLIKYTNDYCDGYVLPTQTSLNSIGKLNKPIVFQDEITLISYSTRHLLESLDILSKDSLIYLHSDLDSVRHGWRFDLALSIREQYPKMKFGLFGISSSFEEIKIFNEVIGCENLITWWPLAIGISGRDIDEERPQLTPLTGDEVESDVISKAWLTHILSKYYEMIKEL